MEGLLSILITELPQRPLIVHGRPVYPLQAPFFPMSLAQETKTCSHSKGDIHDVKIFSFVPGFSMMKKKRTNFTLRIYGTVLSTSVVHSLLF